MADLEAIHKAIKEIQEDCRTLSLKLYGENGYDGDIDRIKENVEVQQDRVDRLEGRFHAMELVMARKEGATEERRTWIKILFATGTTGGVTGFGALITVLVQMFS